MKKSCLTCAWYRNGLCTNESHQNIKVNIINEDGGNLYEQFVWDRFGKHYFVEDTTYDLEITDKINYREVVDEMFGEMNVSERLKERFVKRLKNLAKEIRETAVESAVKNIQSTLESDAELKDDPDGEIRIENPSEFYCSNHWG